MEHGRSPTTPPVEFETHAGPLPPLEAVDSTGRRDDPTMDVREDAGLSSDYRLKLNSYDLGVDIELADAIQRLRFEHPEVHAVILTSLKERDLLRRREHLHAARLDARGEGQLLQVHQRNAPRDRGCERPFGAAVSRGVERHLRRRRLRARAGLRRNPPRRRRQLGRQPAGNTAPRRAPRHRRPHARRRQAQGPTGSCRLSSARSPRASKASVRWSGASSTRCIRPVSSRLRSPKRAKRARGAASDRPPSGPGDHARPAGAAGDR